MTLYEYMKLRHQMRMLEALKDQARFWLKCGFELDELQERTWSDGEIEIMPKCMGDG